MAITLVTGVPGSGKTAWVVDHVIGIEGKRPIVVDGIPDLQLDADPAPPIKDWTAHVEDQSSQSGRKLEFTFQTGALVVIDECQRVFPRRAVGKSVPDYIAAFETHRHKGLDFILITQHPRLLDSHVRSLVGRHVHFRQTWQGRHKYEWAECQDPESTAARQLAARDRYVLPKRAFTRYKSAEVHTKQKFKLPFYAYALIGGVVLLGAMAGKMYFNIKEKLNPVASVPSESKPFESVPVRKIDADKKPTLTVAEYHEQYAPRVPGYFYTAPVYDSVTQPVDAPLPMGCVQRSEKDCRCIDQQGNKYAAPLDVCKSFVRDGLFIPWRNIAKERQEQEREMQRVAAERKAEMLSLRQAEARQNRQVMQADAQEQPKEPAKSS